MLPFDFSHLGRIASGLSGSRRFVSPREFFAYKLTIRDSFNPILHAGRLMQQYLVDSFLKVRA